MSEAKPFCISKWEVWEAYKRVRANQGAAGVDEQSIADFERNLKGNLYKIWNRMSSGSYFPPPVRTVKIPKANGGERKLGIPTVADRIAQQVVKSSLEPAVDPLFHPDSYGYRPGKSALEAVGQARQRCWRYDWVIDLDIKGFFDNIPSDLLLRAVKRHARESWMVLYIERWLKAPAQEEDGRLVPRDKGTPQGGVVSPLLANLFLHYAFDRWMAERYPQLRFERFADDAIVHCRTEAEAQEVRAAMPRACGLRAGISSRCNPPRSIQSLASQFSQIESAWEGRVRAASAGESVRPRSRAGGRHVSGAAALLVLLPAPARARLIAADLWFGDSRCDATPLRLLTEFGRLAFASLLFADVGQAFEHIEAVPDLVDGKPFSQNLFGPRPVL